MFTTTQPVPDRYEPLLLKTALTELAAGTRPTATGPDDFPVFDSDPLAARHRVVSRFMTDARDKPLKGLKVRDVDGGAEMLDADAAGRFEHLLAVVARELWYWKRAVKKTTLAGTKLRGWAYSSDPTLYPLRPLAQALLRGLTGPPPLPFEAVSQLLDAATIPRVGNEVRTYVPIEKLLPLAAATCAAGGVNDQILDALRELRRLVAPDGHDLGSQLRQRREMTEQIDAIINPQARAAAAPRPSPVEPGEPWADAVSAELRGPTGAKWAALLEYAAGATGSQPTQKWLKGSKPLVETIGIDAFATSMGQWLELALKPRTAAMNQEQLRVTAFGPHDPMADLFSSKNEETLKGLVWIAGGTDRPALAGGLGMLAERCYKKIPQIGPRSAKVANACLVALTSMTGRQATAELSRLKSIVRQPTGRKMIERALSRVAGKQGVTVEDLEESTVPKFALVEGATERKLGEVTLRIALTPRGEVEQSWTGGDGKARKSVPASVKAEHGAALKAIKKELADLDKTITAQRLRIERLFLRRTPWAFEAWREAYHDHPLVQTLSRRLIWTFETDGERSAAAAAWDGKRFVNPADEPVEIHPAKTRVRLWHPSSADGAEVLAWRRWLETREITQPFKQAHREIYLLTDAERRTRTYSNRFAQHVIRQHQFQALCQQRGWKYQLMGGFDFHNYPTLEIPTWDTKVEFWVEAATGTGMSANGIAMHLSTDQVRFLDPRGGEPRPLADVPPLLMSEVFRDVDLFVGVASVGNDPTWQDGGPGGRFRDYWHATSFGELTASAVTRKAVLESLLPRLSKLKDKWSLADRFLVIKGLLRTYKIHLGSGNILMAPNDQYLCIVPDASARAGDNVFLPFEGDATLSIILSKAFLLAQDAKITDPTITRQIDAT